MEDITTCSDEERLNNILADIQRCKTYEEFKSRGWDVNATTHRISYRFMPTGVISNMWGESLTSSICTTDNPAILSLYGISCGYYADRSYCVALYVYFCSEYRGREYEEVFMDARKLWRRNSPASCPFCGGSDVTVESFCGEYNIVCHDCNLAVEEVYGENNIFCPEMSDEDRKRKLLGKWGRRPKI